MSRTPWKYVGGPALLYPDNVDTVRLWSDDPHVQLNEMDNFCQSVLESNDCSTETVSTAQKAIWQIDQVRTSIRDGKILEAVSMALAIGIMVDGLALSHEFDRDLQAGQRLREGGFEGSRRMPGDRNVHTQWISIDQELEGTIKSQRTRAAEIARRTGSKPETVRKYLNRRR